MNNDEVIAGYNLNGILIIYAKQVLTTNRLVEDLMMAKKIISEQEQKIQELEGIKDDK